VGSAYEITLKGDLMQTIAQQDKKPPADPEPKLPLTKEEQIEWFKRQAEIDLAAQKLFQGKKPT
jgi:hypothetical protein